MTCFSRETTMTTMRAKFQVSGVEKFAQFGQRCTDNADRASRRCGRDERGRCVANDGCADAPQPAAMRSPEQRK